MTLELRTDRTLIRATGGSDRYLVARFTAPGSDRPQARPPVNVAFVIDRSGSMEGQKIALAKKAVQAAVATLRTGDRFAIVAYDDRVEVAIPATNATAEAKRHAAQALSAIDARGSTNLGEGWLRGCEQVASLADDRYISRVVLLTDGLANQGIVDSEELRAHAGALRTRGVMTTAIGLGEDFNEELLRSMSLSGGGNFYFVESAGQIADTIMSELQEALDVVARSVALAVRVPDGALVEALTEAIVEREGPYSRILLGDAVSDQEFEVVLRLNFPAGEIGQPAPVLIVLDDRDGVLRSTHEVAWEYADHHRNNVQDRDRTVDRIVARLYAARAKREAVRLNRAHDFGAAGSAIRAVAKRVRSYAGDDAELNAVAAALDGDATRFAARMDEVSRKHEHFASATLSRMRTSEGKAMKGSR